MAGVVKVKGEEVRVIVPVRVSVRAREELRKFAAETGMPVNQVIITALEAAIPGFKA